MRRGVEFAGLFLLSWCVLSTPANGFETHVIWEPVSTGGSEGQYPCIAVDSSGTLHITSYSETQDGLQYSTNAGGDWVTAIIAPTGQTGSIAVDSTDHVRITYQTSWGPLGYASNAPGSWTSSLFCTNGRLWSSRTIAMDGSDHIHKIYFDADDQELRYGTSAFGEWFEATVHEGSVGPASIAVDALNHAHISFQDEWTGDLKYATNSSGDWVTTSIDAEGASGLLTSIAVDGSGSAHIAYCTSGESVLKYATNTSGDWVVTTLKSDYVHSAVSIAVDRAGRAHICYGFDNHIEYATNASGQWTSTILDPAYLLGTCNPSLALDREDRVHIAYYGFDGADKDLKYATNASGVWATQSLPSYGTKAEYLSVAVDVSDALHLSYADPMNNSLSYLTNRSGAWDFSVIASGTPTYTSITTDPSGHVYVACANGEHVKYSTDVSGAWETSDLGGYGTLQDLSLAVDRVGHAHVTWVTYIPNQPGDPWTCGGYLFYATNKTGSWEKHNVRSLGCGWSGDVSVALDSGNRPRIVFLDKEDDDLLYGWEVLDGFWRFEVLDPDGGQVSSIALDREDKVHVVYQDMGSYVVKYATNLSGVWETVILDPEGARRPSMRLDKWGFVHVSYSDPLSSSLRYATNASGAWSRQTAYEGSAIPSIAVSSDLTPLIAHIGPGGTLLLTTGTTPFCPDDDEDGYAVPGGSCGPVDCDDANPLVHPEDPPEGPGGSPVCGDDLDDDCDGLVDLEDPGCVPCVDSDGDGYGNPLSENCPHVGWDCDDADPGRNPGTPEICDGVDNNCGGVDEEPAASDSCRDQWDCNGAEMCYQGVCVDGPDPCFDGNECTYDSCQEWYPGPACHNGCNAVDHLDPCCEDPACSYRPVCVCIDNDGDGYGSPASSVCPSPELDCDDATPNVNPGHTEVAGNGIDDDCDGQVDESCFIATAAFGTEVSGKIDVLRYFRDRYLQTNPEGRAVVEAYYRISPAIADFIKEKGWLSAVVRTLLLPVVGAVTLLV